MKQRCVLFPAGGVKDVPGHDSWLGAVAQGRRAREGRS